MTIEERVTDKKAQSDDAVFDHALRPKSLGEYIGQKQVKDNLRVFMQAARQRQEPLEHCLLVSPPGLGKTTLAHVIATEMQGNVRQTQGPAIERAGDLAAIITNCQPGDILFIDEIHGLPKNVEELLYPCMEDGVLDLVVGKGMAARSIQLSIPPITIVGATTRLSQLSSPLRDRFGHHFRLSYYDAQDLADILVRSARLLQIAIEASAVSLLSRRSRGTPRIANRLLRRVRDFAQVSQHDTITESLTEHALRQLEIDDEGLDHMDRAILEAIMDKFDGGPVGLSTIAAATSEETETLEDVIEPFLMQKGFLTRTPRGRMATKRAYEHLKRVPPAHLQTLL